MQKNTIEARVVSYGKGNIEEDGNDILYKIDVEKNGTAWNVRRSYAEFREFHKNVKSTQAEMPSLPKKKLLKMKKEEDLEIRRIQLDEYMIEISKKQDLYANAHLIKFLEVKEKSSLIIEMNYLPPFNPY